ncbi:MAG: abortive infection family protein [Rhodospirillales bacterium]|jgi:hypothetical protein
MVALKSKSRALLEDILRMKEGYVLNFTDKTFSEFFAKLDFDIDAEKYRANGNSKAKRMRAFIDIEGPSAVALVLRSLWKHREESGYSEDQSEIDKLRTSFQAVVAEVEGDTIANTEGVEKFAKDPTLEALVESIEAEIRAQRPAMALDRLHTYCLKRFSALLDKHQLAWTSAEPLHSRVGKYSKFVGNMRGDHDMTFMIIRGGMGIFEKFNDVRNNRTAAHDNQIIDPSEARFIFDFVTAYLRFVKRFEGE